MSGNVKIENNEYTVIDSLTNITLADSFLRNKTGTGNGEAKMYIGQTGEHLDDFVGSTFDDKNAFFLKRDFIDMLDELKDEFYKPSSTYLKIVHYNGVKTHIDVTNEMYLKWEAMKNKISSYPAVMRFKFSRSNVNPPRIYINSDSEFYKDLRDIGIPNITYCSILKLKNANDEDEYYFKPFVSYSNEIEGYKAATKLERQELEKIEESSESKTKKETLVSARVGQGKYREKLLNDMPYCPFTKINDERLLIASHIKPWAVSDDKEKIDYQNGFMFSPTYDTLFDRGLITFRDSGELVVSEFISPMNQKRLNIEAGKQIGIDRFMTDARKKYLIYHRTKIYNGVEKFTD